MSTLWIGTGHSIEPLVLQNLTVRFLEREFDEVVDYALHLGLNRGFNVPEYRSN